MRAYVFPSVETPDSSAKKAVLPQFIDPNLSFAVQFAIMAVTYGLLIIVIHTLYAVGAQRTRTWLSTEAGGRAINNLGGALFMVFAVLLAVASK